MTDSAMTDGTTTDGTTTDGAAPEFSRRVLLARVGPQPFRREIVASAAEREALARRFDLVSLERLSAHIELRPYEKEMFLLHAVLEAEFTQSCVITLDPVPGTASEEFSVLYGPPEAEESVAGRVEDDFAFEPLQGDAIDVGEAVAQEFSLALPPFPRVSGADIEAELPPAEHEPGALADLSRLLAPRNTAID